jgi:hypothetical protein
MRLPLPNRMCGSVSLQSSVALVTPYTVAMQHRVLTADQLGIDVAATMTDVGPVARPESLGKLIFLSGDPTGGVTIDLSIWRLVGPSKMA